MTWYFTIGPADHNSVGIATHICTWAILEPQIIPQFLRDKLWVVSYHFHMNPLFFLHHSLFTVS